MQQLSTVASLRVALKDERSKGKLIGLVPTMGNLHAGHLALVKRARLLSDIVVVSVFVNPLQFDQQADLEAYPRTLEDDAAQLRASGVDVLFAPTAQEMYPAGMQQTSFVEVPQVTQRMEGAVRQGHFTGVATVVSKLFNQVQPTVAVFGEKDFQQLLVVRKLVRDLDIPVEIVAEPTIREEDGLAMSSRNRLLSEGDRRIAPGLYRTLKKVATEIQAGHRHFRTLEKTGCEWLIESGLQPDYVEICDDQTLLPASASTKDLIILSAARLGTVRLLDNLRLNLNNQG